MAAHPIVHMDISAKDPAASAKFYADVFGWEIRHDTNFDYYMFAGSGGPGGGWVKADGQQYKPGDLIPYIDTDNIEASLQAVQAHGGQILLPKTEIPGVGWFAFFADPSGNRLGLYTDMHPQ